MIDWARVSELQKDIGAEAFDEVKQLFVEEMEQVLGRLEAGRVEDWEDGFHFLKSSALNMGFGEVARLCQDAEQRARTGATAPADAAAVMVSFRSSVTALERGLAR